EYINVEEFEKNLNFADLRMDSADVADGNARDGKKKAPKDASGKDSKKGSKKGSKKVYINAADLENDIVQWLANDNDRSDSKHTGPASVEDIGREYEIVEEHEIVEQDIIEFRITSIE